MKRLLGVKVLTVCMLLAVIPAALSADDRTNRKEVRKTDAKQILIVGLPDNVKSNYFYKGMIAKETGMKADSIDLAYNSIIAENIAVSCKGGDCRFISGMAVNGQMVNEIQVKGEEEGCYSDLSAVSTESLQEELDKAGADYLLVLNQHYLKWQEQPLRTLFHIVSYTLFDKDKKEVCRGNNFFTSMNLENADKIRKISRKSSSKIAASIIKTISQE